MPSDTLTRGGAQELADRIATYWRKRGLMVDVRVKMEVPPEYGRGLHIKGPMWVVRSSMRGGQPEGA